jgi:hypothetical protein
MATLPAGTWPGQRTIAGTRKPPSRTVPLLCAKTASSPDWTAVDRALSHIYRGGEIGTLFKRTFGDAKPGRVLGTLYLVAGLPD